ncbi:MAG: hypothetical protein JSR99_10080 [Proteobacteria bacterium]|nr:hypothetical protein [Pseudomonadota bacterium]
METERAADRIVRGLNLIRSEASRLDSARAEGKSFEAKLALKTIKDECFLLREYLHEIRGAVDRD